MKLETNEIINVWNKYINLCKNWYFNRKYSISRIYDHFFAKLFYRLSQKIGDKSFQTSFSKNINLCSNESFEILEVWKPSLDFSTRKISIPNLYDIIMYEVLTHRLYSEISKIFSMSDDLNNELFEEKYFSYAHRVNLKSKTLDYEHYLKWWLKYWKVKNKIIKDNTFYMESDIKWFYDNIEHDNFIQLLLKFFHEKLISSENLEYIHDILYSLNNVFYKVSWFKTKGLPQWLVASDMLSQIYLWLIFYFDDSLKLDSDIYWIKWTWTKIILFADDITLVSKREKNLYKGFRFLKNILEKNWLNLNISKTTDIKYNTSYINVSDINIENVRKNNITEIKKLIDRILEILSSNTYDIQEWELKTIFKWFWKIDYLDKDDRDIFLKNFLKNWINFNKKLLSNSKKISLLLIISPSNFKHLLILLDNYFKEFIPNGDLEDVFISNYLIESDLYLPLANLIFLYLDLDWNLIKIWNNIKDNVLSSWNNSLIDLLDWEKKYLRSNLLKNKLYWLYNLIYKEVEDENDYAENIIWVKLNSIFDIDINVTSKLSDMLHILLLKKVIDIESLERLSNILDDLLLNKMTHKTFYLKNPSFLADLYSMFNILLSLLHSVEINKLEKVKIWWNMWIINNYDTNNSVLLKSSMTKIVKSYKNLLYYVTKNRARFNHKEADVLIEENIEILALKHSNTFSLHIKSFISDIFKEINNNLELYY
jgi:hypothetical protein